MSPRSDVVVALATPRGVGALSIIRATGGGVHALFAHILVPYRSDRPVGSLPIRVRVMDGAQQFDDAIATYGFAPATYTGEEGVEVTVHGNPLIVDRLLRVMVGAGAMIAPPGEFTRRSVMNGKMDLLAAESILAISEAVTDKAVVTARGGLEGKLREFHKDCRLQLLVVAAELEARLDYPDDELAEETDDVLVNTLNTVADECDTIVSGYANAETLLRGATVALVGQVNAGKSSLFNALVGLNRALVHETPGTTRDVVEARFEIDGVMVRLLDTAGHRSATNSVEKAGIALAAKMVEAADLLVIVVRAGKDGVSVRDQALIDRPKTHNQKQLVVYNGIDCPGVAAVPASMMGTSAKALTGIEALKVAISQALISDYSTHSAAALTSERQRSALVEVCRASREAASALAVAGVSVSAFLVLEALSALDDLNGKDARHDTLSTLFERFCVGK